MPANIPVRGVFSIPPQHFNMHILPRKEGLIIGLVERGGRSRVSMSISWEDVWEGYRQAQSEEEGKVMTLKEIREGL